MCIDADTDQEIPVEALTIHECARRCRANASHFAYGTNDFGEEGCQDGFCKCYCIKQCKLLSQEMYRFFKYNIEVDSANLGRFNFVM